MRPIKVVHSVLLKKKNADIYLQSYYKMEYWCLYFTTYNCYEL